jgi:hypothetical protein
VTKLKKPKLWQNLKTQTVIKLKKKLWQNLKDIIVTKLKNSNCAKLKKNCYNSKPQIMILIKMTVVTEEVITTSFSKHTLTPWQPTNSPYWFVPRVPTCRASSLAVGDCLGFRAPWFFVVRYVKLGGACSVLGLLLSPGFLRGCPPLLGSSSSGVTLPRSPGYTPRPRVSLFS